MVSQPIEKVWIDPPKYWAATAGMSEHEIAVLLESIVSCVWAGDVQALRRFDFVSLENPYFQWRKARKANQAEHQR